MALIFIFISAISVICVLFSGQALRQVIVLTVEIRLRRIYAGVQTV
jgi:hypothetical protein